MFLARRPSDSKVTRFLADSGGRPLSYGPVGIAASQRPLRGEVDELRAEIGRGLRDYERARDALRAWKQFQLGWVELFPAAAGLEPGVVVAVLVCHLGFWSLNGCRVVYGIEPDPGEKRFGIAYGTLTNHAEAGEEIFEVSHDVASDAVLYRIRAVSWPRAPLARLGRPFVRRLQERFRHDSLEAMRRAIADA
jgi:uncharacterized protein (UPF0548 family)